MWRSALFSIVSRTHWRNVVYFAWTIHHKCADVVKLEFFPVWYLVACGEADTTMLLEDRLLFLAG
jgi:hypothetical protein